MIHRNVPAFLAKATPSVTRLRSLFSIQRWMRPLRILAPSLISLTFAAVAHAQGTMDFSGAQTLMGTFKTFAAKPKLVQISKAYGQQKEGRTTLPRNKYVEVRPDKPTSKEEATRPEFKTCKFTTEAIVSEGIDKGELRKVCTEPTCPVHHPKPRSQKVTVDPKAKAQEERQRREIAIANTTGIRTLAAIAEAVPVRLMKRDLLFVAERLASLLDENRLSILARRYGIKKAKDSDSLVKLFAAYLRRAEESVLGSVLIETTILYLSTRHNPAQVLSQAAAVYKVDTDAIALKVKQEFAAKEKAQTAKKPVVKAQPKAGRRQRLLSLCPSSRWSLPTRTLHFCARPSRPGRCSCAAGAPIVLRPDGFGFSPWARRSRRA